VGKEPARYDAPPPMATTRKKTSKAREPVARQADVTRQRIFIETMEKVLGDTEKVIVDDKAGPGVVPFLPLSEFTKKAPTPPEGQP